MLFSKAQAKELGLKTFVSGLACPKGHLAERFVSNGACVICINDRKKAYRQSDEKYRAAEKKYAATYAIVANMTSERMERRSASIKRTYAKNRAALIEKAKARKAQRRAAEGTFNRQDIVRILGMQKGKCAECSTTLGGKYHIDHIMPIALGGANWPKNLQCLCAPCNLKKSAKHPLDWARQNERLL